MNVRACALLAASLCGCAGSGGGEADAPVCRPPPGPVERCVVPSTRYDAGPFHRFLLGSGYRDLWATPIVVPLLDLDRTAGGLEPVRELGHGQSATLALRGADGRSYSFRTTDKDMRRAAGAAGSLPGIEAAYRDQAAAGHPGAPVVASVLARAAGLLEPERRLVVVPDSPRLASFEKFAGRLGTFEEYPTAGEAGRPGTFGAREIVDTWELLDRMRRGPAEKPDARAYLRARLVDLVLDDVDRHPGQWRFARLRPGGPWQPLPEDRDLAFARFEGFMVQVARPWFPLLGVFDAEYDLHGLTVQAVVTDPRLLAPLSRTAWSEEAAEVRRRLDARVVEQAVAALPEAWRAKNGAALARTLRRRIAGLPRAADALYERMAAVVEIHGTEAAEEVRAEAVGSDRAWLRVTAAGQPAPVFERLLLRGETRRVRLCGFDASDRLSYEPLATAYIEVEIEPQCKPPREPIMIHTPRDVDDDDEDDD